MSLEDKLEECLLLLTDGNFAYDFDATESSKSKHSVTVFENSNNYTCHGNCRKSVFKGAIEYIIQKY